MKEMNDLQKKIKVGVVGLGRAGWNIHVKNLQGLPEAFDIVEVADPAPERQREAISTLGCRAFGSLREMLDEGESELVVIATPNVFHEDDAAMALAAGKHCVLEKPMAMSYAGALNVIETARLYGRKLFVHQQHLFGKEYQMLRKVYDTGVLGDLVQIRYNWCSYARRTDWQTLKSNGGGHLNNHGPHALTSALALLEAPIISVCSEVRHVKDAGDADDHIHLFLKAANGRAADLFLSTCCALSLPRTALIGSAGMALQDEQKAVRVRYYNKDEAPDIVVVDGSSSERKYGTGEVLPWREQTFSPSDLRLSGSFYQNVFDGLRHDAPLVVPPEMALEVTRVIEWAYTGADPAGSAAQISAVHA